MFPKSKNSKIMKCFIMEDGKYIVKNNQNLKKIKTKKKMLQL